MTTTTPPPDPLFDNMYRELEAAIRNNNDVDVVRFDSYWAPLFRNTGVDELGVAEYMRRGREWSAQIDVYTPVRIYRDDGNGKKTILGTLPPMLSRLKPITDVQTALGSGSDMVSMFTTAYQRGFSLSPDAATAAKGLIAAFPKAIDVDEARKNAALAKQAESELKGQPPTTAKDAPPPNGVTNDMDWK